MLPESANYPVLAISRATILKPTESTFKAVFVDRGNFSEPCHRPEINVKKVEKKVVLKVDLIGNVRKSCRNTRQWFCGGNPTPAGLLGPGWFQTEIMPISEG